MLPWIGFHLPVVSWHFLSISYMLYEHEWLAEPGGRDELKVEGESCGCICFPILL